MPQSNTESYNSNSHGDRGNVSQTVTRFVDAVEDLATALDAPESVTNEFVDAGQDMADLVEETAQQSDENAERIDDNEEQIDAERDRRSAEIEGCHNRISNTIEDAGFGDDNPGNDAGKTTIQDDESTALERVCALPEHVVEDNLTANQRRARSVARRIDEYGKQVPAGIAITSSRIKRVLTAQEDTTIHRQTVKRVAQFLEDFGDGEVEIRETRGGKTTVVFDEQLVNRVTRVVTADRGDGVTAAVV